MPIHFVLLSATIAALTAPNDHRAIVRLCDGHGLGESSCTAVLGFDGLLQSISADLDTQFTPLTAVL